MHGRPAPFGAVRGGGTVLAFEPSEIDAGCTDLLIQNAALGIGDGAVLEEVLLSPALEHAVGDLDVAQVPSTRDHLGLMAAVAQARDLP